MLRCIKDLHKVGFIHRDIKPGNFLSEIDGNNIFIIDFGLCRQYMDLKTKSLRDSIIINNINNRKRNCTF